MTHHQVPDWSINTPERGFVQPAFRAFTDRRRVASSTSIATTEIQKAIEKLGPEERAQLWTWFQEAEEIDELVAAIDEVIQAAEEGRVFSLEEIKMQMQSWITK